VILLASLPAHAKLHQVSVGNYYFEDDATGARDPLTVDEGDQIRFTVRQAAYPPHDIVIEEYGIDSPPLNLFQTYTTPPLNKPGTFALYCRAHRARGHETTLIVKAKVSPPPSTPSSPPPPKKKAKPATAAPKAETTSTPSSAAAPASPTPAESLAPVGVGEATDRRTPPPDPESLAGILGRRFGGELPWTTAVWQALIAALPIVAAAAYALKRESQRQAAVPMPLPRAKTAPTTTPPPRVSAPRRTPSRSSSQRRSQRRRSSD
jgi:plastocyanin